MGDSTRFSLCYLIPTERLPARHSPKENKGNESVNYRVSQVSGKIPSIVEFPMVWPPIRSFEGSTIPYAPTLMRRRLF